MGLVGIITSVNPSAMQYAKMISEGEIPSAVATGIMIGITKKILAEADPIKNCKKKISKKTSKIATYLP